MCVLGGGGGGGHENELFQFGFPQSKTWEKNLAAHYLFRDDLRKHQEGRRDMRKDGGKRQQWKVITSIMVDYVEGSIQSSPLAEGTINP